MDENLLDAIDRVERSIVDADFDRELIKQRVVGNG